MGEVEEAIALVDPLTIGSHSFGKTRRIERAILFVNFDQKRGDDKQIERDRRQYLPSIGMFSITDVIKVAEYVISRWSHVIHGIRYIAGGLEEAMLFAQRCGWRTVDSVQNSPLCCCSGRTYPAGSTRSITATDSVGTRYCWSTCP